MLRRGDPAVVRPLMACLVAALLLAIAPTAQPWGFEGHDLVNGQAIGALPEPLRAFYNRHRELVVRHSVDADLFREFDPNEAPRHFLDIDHYGRYPFSELPLEYRDAVAKYGKERVHRYGLVPWVIGWRYHAVVRAYRARRFDQVVVYSAWLGHYVGDCHVPLHATENYDGQLTQQRGAHRRWETELVRRYVTGDEIRPAPAVRLEGKIHHLAREWLLESYRLVEGVLQADREALREEPFAWEKFRDAQIGVVRQRLTDASHRLACLWYTAWLQAGQPELPTRRPR